GYDDPRMLLPIGWALEDKGYDVVRVSSGKAALKVLARNDFDLILIDLDLHVTNGIDLVHKAKQLNPETQVIILCCKEDVTYSHDTLRMDADEYIFKPCSKAKVWKRVGNCLERLQLKRSIESLELDINGTDEAILKKMRIMLDKIQTPVFQMKEILKQIKWGSFLNTDYEVAIKLRELDKIVRRLNDALAELRGEISEANEDLTVKEKRADWKEDMINPLLGNFPH
ncbi:MAG: response regulator, partial [Desulfobacteraceae bacterium]